MTKAVRKNKNKKSYFLKDRALIKFILSHSKKLTIDFSKLKIPSFSDFLENNQEFIYVNKKNITKINIFDKFIFKEKDNKIFGNKNLPKFNLSFEDYEIENNNKNEYKINSFLFD